MRANDLRYTKLVVRKRTTTVRWYGPYTCCTARTPYFFTQKVRTRTIIRTGPPKAKQMAAIFTPFCLHFFFYIYVLFLNLDLLKLSKMCVFNPTCVPT